MINGKRYAWEDITITFPHGVLIDVDSIEYSDKKEVEPVYGKGSNPQGYGSGKYSAEAKVTLLKEEFDRLVDYAKSLGSKLYRLRPFNITVGYANEDEPTKTDILRGCKIKSRSQGGSQGDTSSKVELELEVLNGIVNDGLEAN